MLVCLLAPELICAFLITPHCCHRLPPLPSSSSWWLLPFSMRISSPSLLIFLFLLVEGGFPRQSSRESLEHPNPVSNNLGFGKIEHVWLEQVSLRSLGRASQLHRTKHDTSADPRIAFCCCRQCFKKPQDHTCLSPPFYRFFYFLEEKTKIAPVSHLNMPGINTFKHLRVSQIQTMPSWWGVMTNTFACVSAWLLKKA